MAFSSAPVQATMAASCRGSTWTGRGSTSRSRASTRTAAASASSPQTSSARWATTSSTSVRPGSRWACGGAARTPGPRRTTPRRCPSCAPRAGTPAGPRPSAAPGACPARHFACRTLVGQSQTRPSSAAREAETQYSPRSCVDEIGRGWPAGLSVTPRVASRSPAPACRTRRGRGEGSPRHARCRWEARASPPARSAGSRAVARDS